MLRAAIVPPPDVLAEVAAATSGLRQLPGVDAVAVDQLDIPVAHFGNLTASDAGRVVRVLREAVEGATGPLVRFSGVVVLGADERGAPRSAGGRATLATGLAGDVEPVADLARFVPEAVERLGLFIDRRVFRPALTLATLDPDGSPRLLASSLSPLTEWAGATWSVPGLTLFRMRLSDGRHMLSEEYDRIALA